MSERGSPRDARSRAPAGWTTAALRASGFLAVAAVGGGLFSAAAQGLTDVMATAYRPVEPIVAERPPLLPTPPAIDVGMATTHATAARDIADLECRALPSSTRAACAREVKLAHFRALQARSLGERAPSRPAKRAAPPAAEGVAAPSDERVPAPLE